MAVLEHQVRSADASALTASSRRGFTIEQYHALGQTGLLGEERIELIEGDIIDMSPIGPAHAAVNDPLTSLLRDAFGSGHTIRNQSPLSLASVALASEPQPDIVVAIGSWFDYYSRHPDPSDVRLVVEISDSSLSYDRSIKAALYALAGLPEYWILNVVDAQLEVYRRPEGSVYEETAVYHKGDSVEPLSAPGRLIPISGFLP